VELSGPGYIFPEKREIATKRIKSSDVSAMSSSPLLLRPALELPSLPVRKRTNAKPIRILIADPQATFRECLRAFLKTRRGFAVVGEAGDSEDALTLAQKLKPDILLLDISMPHADGMSIIRDIRDSDLGVRIVVLTASIAKSDTLRALQLGAGGVVLKTDGTDVLVEGIRRVMAGEYWIGKESVASLIQASTDHGRVQRSSNKFGLTPRENEVIVAVLAGYSNPEIAEKLAVSEQTVKHHLTHIFDKLGVYSRVQLALFAVNHRLCDEAG
jgi:DNA-binding NarL/FixJ family response regulator